MAISAYFIWQSIDSKNTTTPPTPNPNPFPTPAPSQSPSPAPTSQDYNAPFKTFSGEGISVEYPSSWFAIEPDSSDKVGIISILSPNTKQRLDSGNFNGYEFDLYVAHSGDLSQTTGTTYTKGANITVGGKNGYWITIQGQNLSEGVVVENNGYYLFSFPPSADKALQNEILKHVKFIN